MTIAVTIVNPSPGGISVTLNGTKLPTIEGTNGGTDFHSLDAGFEPQNELVVYYGMSRNYRYEIDVLTDGDPMQLFLFMGVGILIEMSIGAVVAQVQGTWIGEDGEAPSPAGGPG